MGKPKNYETAKEQETAVLVAVTRKTQAEDKTKEYLDELAFLAETAGAKTLTPFHAKTRKTRYQNVCGFGQAG